jgi:hypothetical protein
LGISDHEPGAIEATHLLLRISLWLDDAEELPSKAPLHAVAHGNA